MEPPDVNHIDIPALIEDTFGFWFNDHVQVRSPFPHYIRKTLKEMSTGRFKQWLDRLDVETGRNLTEEKVAKKLEEIIFDMALVLVETEDEHITILYPFVPRIGDEIFEDRYSNKGRSELIERQIFGEGESAYLKVKARTIEDGKEWETQFELPT